LSFAPGFRVGPLFVKNQWDILVTGIIPKDTDSILNGPYLNMTKIVTLISLGNLGPPYFEGLD
jgi:hypothetical protein